jgi:hypothetical protein
MKAVYSSLTAFLEHYRALKSAGSRTAEENQLLAAMSPAMDALTSDERAALDSHVDDSAIKRHRERAELKLRRELIARAMITG